MNPRIRYTYGIYDRDGALRYVGLHDSEEDAWQIFLGWPSADEIEDSKSRGFSCRPVVVAVR